MPLQVFIVDRRELADSLAREIGALPESGLEIRTASMVEHWRASVPKTDVLVVFHTEEETLQFADFVGAIIVVTSESLALYQRSLDAGADIVVPYTTNPSQFVAIVHSAHRAFKARQALEEQNAAMQTKAAQDREINIAVEFMSEQLSVFPIEARTRLRKQAREQRKTMHEIAKVVIAAKKLLSKNS